MPYKTLYWEDVVEGDALPPLTFELSLLRLVAFVRAAGLYDYIHFDGDYARSVGMRDAFISTPHVEGLFARLLTDWTGPQGIIRSISFSMRDQSCTNDMLEITAKVARKYQDADGTYLVDLEKLNMGHERAPHAAAGSATLSLPSKTGTAAKGLDQKSSKTTSKENPDLPEFAKALIGVIKEGSWNPTHALTEHENLLWCEALEDWNPLYWDHEYAKTSPYQGIIAPPARGWFFGAGTAVHSGLGYGRPGAHVPQAIRDGLTGDALLKSLRKGLIEKNTPFPLPEFPEAAMALANAEYFKPIRPGDIVHNKIELLNCSPLKRTKVGEGYFIDFVNACYNQREELTKTMTMTQFAYRAS